MNELQRKGRRTLLMIAAAFFLPILLAMVLYFGNSDWRPGTTTVRGTLIVPPVPLPDTALDAAGEVRLREVWSMLVLTDADCDAECAAALVSMRQVRLSLGPKMTRMQTILLPATELAAAPALLAEHPVLTIAEPAQAAAVRALISDYNQGDILLVDPFGNLMMRYTRGADMGDIRKDLGHLFQLSTIG